MAGKKMADSGYQYDIPANRGRVSRGEGYKQKPLGPSDEDRLRWQRFLAELPERIARIRDEETPLLCPTCGSTTPPVVGLKRCSRCQQSLPVSSFYRNRANAGGRDYYCRECRRRVRADEWQREKRKALKVAS